MKRFLLNALLFIGIFAVTFGGVIFGLQQFAGGHEEDPIALESPDEKGEEKQEEHAEEHSEKSEEESALKEVAEATKKVEPKKEEPKAAEEEVADVVEKVKESKSEKSEEEAPKPVVEPSKPMKYAGSAYESALVALFSKHDTEVEKIEESIRKWEEENVATEDKIKIAKVVKGYQYSPRFREFMPGVSIFFENSNARAIKEPVAVKVRYRRIATNEVWSVEERVLPFNKIDKLEEGDRYQKHFVSSRGVESMRHIMPDLQAKVFVNGRQFMTFKVGESEVLDWN